MLPPDIDSREAALALAEAYEKILAAAIQISSVSDEPESVTILRDHLESVKRTHKRILLLKKGSSGFKDLCRTDLQCMRYFMEECIRKIEYLLD